MEKKDNEVTLEMLEEIIKKIQNPKELTKEEMKEIDKFYDKYLKLKFIQWFKEQEQSKTEE